MTYSSAQSKLARGIEHVKTFQAEAADFLDEDAYVFSVERKRRSAQEVAYRCFATEIETMPEHWPLLAGEAIQNLRSALDHAVYVLVPKRKRGISGFPIFTDECEFQVLGRKLIPKIPVPVEALIERAQPYRHTPQAPTRDPLEILRSLSNIDKHRTLTTIACAVDMEWIGVELGITVKDWKPATGRALGQGKTEISSFIAVSKTDIDEMQVDPQFSYEIRVEGLPLDMLAVIARRVFEVVTECETAHAIQPFAAYPI